MTSWIEIQSGLFVFCIENLWYISFISEYSENLHMISNSAYIKHETQSTKINKTNLNKNHTKSNMV